MSPQQLTGSGLVPDERFLFYLAQFGQRGKFSQRAEPHVDHAEELERSEPVRQTFNLPIGRATVVHNQLHNLRTKTSKHIETAFLIKLITAIYRSCMVLLAACLCKVFNI